MKPKLKQHPLTDAEIVFTHTMIGLLNGNLGRMINMTVEAYCDYLAEMKRPDFETLQAHMDEIDDEMSKALKAWFIVCRTMGTKAKLLQGMEPGSIQRPPNE